MDLILAVHRGGGLELGLGLLCIIGIVAFVILARTPS